MRIGFDGKRAFLNETGLGNYSRDTIRLLSKYYPNNKYLVYTPENTFNDRSKFIRQSENIIIKTPKSIIDKMMKSIWRSKRIIKDLSIENIDIYHGLSHELPIGIENTNIKTVVTIHDLIFIRYPELFNYFDRKIYFKKFISACNRADKIIAVSQQTKQDIIKFFGISNEKIDVIYQGCNNIFQKKIDISIKNNIISKYNIPEDYILYVGKIEERKNLLKLLEAVQKIPNQHLVIVGNGTKYKRKCLSYIYKHKMENRTHLLSNLNIQELSAIYTEAKIMVYPSIFEGFGIPILEALFSKTPVITSKGGCFTETGGPKSKYINPLSSKEIRNAIQEIQSSKDLQKIMKEEGFKYAQKFTDKNIANNLHDLYNKL